MPSILGFENGLGGLDEIMAISMGSAIFTFAIAIAMYVMQSLSLYTIAKRRGILKPWLAWIPVGSDWIMGCISDQYRYVAKGQTKNKRKTLLVLSLCSIVASLVMIVLYLVLMITVVFNGEMPSDLLFSKIAGTLLAMVGISLVTAGISITLAIIQYMALYDTFASCDPNNATLYLVLSILFSLQPIFLLVCRNKDFGMPPRTYTPQPDPYVHRGPEF